MRQVWTGAALVTAAATAAAVAQDVPATSRNPLGEAIRAALGPAGAPIRIAVFTRADCPECATARDELQALAARIGFRAALFDMDRDAGLARDLGLDTAPSYVLPDKLLRGAIPSLVLERYLAD